MQDKAKVISFSLWGDKEIYTTGAIENFKMAPFIYPQWHCRIYVDNTVPKPIIKELTKHGEVINMSDNDFSNGYHRLFWRYLPLSDKTIERFISRDCDSRLNAREFSAVNEWIESDLPFHVMRDHPCHSLPIQGGMWGAKPCVENIKEDIKTFLKSYINTMPYKENYMVDQIFLNQILWPKIVNKHLAHSEIHKHTGKELPFKVKLAPDMFVGQIINADNTIFSGKREY
jgi:hypothetical protein